MHYLLRDLRDRAHSQRFLVLFGQYLPEFIVTVLNRVPHVLLLNLFENIVTQKSLIRVLNLILVGNILVVHKFWRLFFWALRLLLDIFNKVV